MSLFNRTGGNVLRNMIAGMCDIFDGLIMVFSFGQLCSGLTFKWIAFYDLRAIRERKRRKK